MGEPEAEAEPEAVGPLPSLRNPTSPALAPAEAWAAFGLDARRTTLDAQGLQIADRQQASLRSRKHLAESTRALRKAVAPEAAKSFSALLKEYQTEVDHLTARSKAAEAAFLDLYRALYEVPDPVPLLHRGVADRHRVLQLEGDMRALETERDRFKAQLSEASGNENLIEELENTLASANAHMEQQIQDAVTARQAEWMAAQAQTVEAYEMREQELLHQISIANESRRNLQRAHDATLAQLSESDSKVEDLKAARSAETAMVVQDLERARGEVTELRRRVAQLESTAPDHAQQADRLDDTMLGGPARDLNMEIADKEVQISQLRDQVDALNKILGGRQERNSVEFARLSQMLRDRDELIGELQGRISGLPSAEEYQTMKREYEIMESMHTATLGQELETDPEAPNGDHLEQRLMGRIKVLENRLTEMRVTLNERDADVKDSRAKTRSLEEQLTDKSQLVLQLEENISAMTRESGKETGRRDEAAWEVWGNEDGPSPSSRPHVVDVAEPSMLDIVAGQRDRFRVRSQELEEDNRKLAERVETVLAERDNVKADNVQLYERIRYLQSYSASTAGEQGGVASVAGTGARNPSNFEDGGILGKYKSMYEDIVNPFTMFNRRERHRRFNEMSAPERITVRTSQRLLSNKQSRLFVFFYVVSLHAFVFVVLAYSRYACLESMILEPAPDAPTLQ